MSNMSYCRFENTYGDLEDCIEAVTNQSNLSEWELPHAKGMYKSCLEFIEAAKSFGFHDEEGNVHPVKDES